MEGRTGRGDTTSERASELEGKVRTHGRTGWMIEREPPHIASPLPPLTAYKLPSPFSASLAPFSPGV
eukprot:6193592-Pleurochrysis_carterae.AAC.1